MATIPIRWPFGGRNLNQSFTNQVPDTCQDDLNVRGLDSVTGRLRGAQRAGLLELGGDESQVCTNLLTTPETFDTGGDWTISGGIIGSGTPAAVSGQANPFGETSPNPAVDIAIQTMTPAAGELIQADGANVQTEQVLTLFVKRPTTGSSQADNFVLYLAESGALHGNQFTVASDGTVTLTTTDLVPVMGFTVTGGVELISNGWYRVYTAVAHASPPLTGRGWRLELGRGGASAGENLWIWGAEMCNGQLTPTPYRSGVIASGEKVQWIEPMTVDDRQITWAANSGGTSVTTTNGQFGTAFNIDGFGGDMRFDAVEGRLYVQISENKIGVYDKTGNLLETVEVPNPPSSGGTDYTRIVQFDIASGDIFCAMGPQTGSIGGLLGTLVAGDPPKTADNESIVRMYRVSRDINGKWRIVWTVFINNSYITSLVVRDDRIYIGRYKPHATVDDQGTPAFSVHTNIFTSNPGNAPAISARIDQTPDETDSDIRLHGIDVSPKGYVALTGVDLALDNSGVYILDTSQDGTVISSEVTAPEVGMGLGCKWDGDNTLYTVGFDTTTGLSEARKFVISATGGISSSTSTSIPNSGILGQTFQTRIDVDAFGNVWIPYQNSGGTGADMVGLSADDITAEIFSTSTFNGTASAANGGWAVAVDTDIPNYRDTTTTWPEHVWLSAHLAYKVRWATSTLAAGSPRTSFAAVVAGGDIKKYQVTNWTTSPPTVSISAPNDSSSGSMETKDFLQGAVLFNKAFFCDGSSYRVYDPKDIETSTIGEVTDFFATKGIVPPRCKLISSWRGRLILARGDNEQEWFMSAQGDPFDWLFFPPVASSTQAVQGSLARAGLVPDITNGIIPYADDLMFMGGDHSIWRFTGDPAAGGQIDLVSDITGMSFGKAWTKDPEGVVYFFGSRGGVYRMTPQQLPQRISLGSIERELQDLDLSTNYVRLAWNYRDEGLHVFQMPYGNVTEQLDHWFWEQKTGGWYKDNYYDTTLISNQPTAVGVIDGDDPDDRKLLIGGGGNTSLSSGDGCIAAWDEEAKTDAGTAIFSKVLIGPFASEGKEVRMTSFTPVMASDQGSCNFRLYATTAADTLGNAVYSGVAHPGRNPTHRLRGRGSHIFLELSDGSTDRWAFETAQVEVHPAGKQRVRAAT